MLAVGGLAIALGGLEQGLPVDPALVEGDLLQGRDLGALAGLDGAHKVRRIHQGVHGAGIQPGIAPPQQLHVQGAVLQIEAVQVGDLQLAPGAGLHPLGEVHHPVVVEIQPRDAVVALGMLGLLLHGDDLSGFVELHDAEALGVVDVVAEDAGPALLGVRRRLLQTGTEAAAVVENAAKSKVETGTNKHERNRRRSSDFDEEDWQEKGKVIDEVKICSYENNYKEVYFAKQTDTSISTVRRIFSFRTQKTAASWSSIFKLVKCLSNECVNANHLVVLLGTMLLYLVGNAAKVHFYLEGNRKFFIEIKFKKDVTVFKKGEKEPVGDNERRNIDDEFK